MSNINRKIKRESLRWSENSSALLHCNAFFYLCCSLSIPILARTRGSGYMINTNNVASLVIVGAA